MNDSTETPSDQEFDQFLRASIHTETPRREWISQCEAAIRNEQSRVERTQRHNRRAAIAALFIAACAGFVLLRLTMQPAVNQNSKASQSQSTDVPPFSAIWNETLYPSPERQEIARSLLSTVEPLDGYLAAKDQSVQDDIEFYWVMPISVTSTDSFPSQPNSPTH